jgi:hypothetical protein
MQLDQEQLHKKNEELMALYQEKSRKHTQITNLYNLLKSRAMMSHIQTAASDSVSHALSSLRDIPSLNSGSTAPAPQTHRVSSRHFDAMRADGNEVERLLQHQRSGSAASGSRPLLSSTAAMPPPQLPFSSGKIICSHVRLIIYDLFQEYG